MVKKLNESASAALFNPFNGSTLLTLFGGHKAVDRPDPIPNSAVKRSIADGSGCIASARVGRRQFLVGLVQSRTQSSALFLVARQGVLTCWLFTGSFAGWINRHLCRFRELC